jgi:hypothetical protein
MRDAAAVQAFEVMSDNLNIVQFISMNRTIKLHYVLVLFLQIQEFVGTSLICLFIMKSILLTYKLMLMILQQIPVTAVQAALTTTAGGVATLSLPPQQQHLEVAGGATATVMLTSEEVDKDKLDKGTCTTERCGENQVHCQVSVNYM